LEGLRARVNGERIIAVLEPRSNTMKLGVHAETLAASLDAADIAILYQPPGQGWEVRHAEGIQIFTSLDEIVAKLVAEVRPGDHLVFMSNGSFGGIHGMVEQALSQQAA
jgi:UDP-N-acetylmuramate: L-alanyl-gamma-D-glutamyl-meso-diaminopimelate ligase